MRHAFGRKITGGAGLDLYLVEFISFYIDAIFGKWLASMSVLHGENHIA